MKMPPALVVRKIPKKDCHTYWKSMLTQAHKNRAANAMRTSTVIVFIGDVCNSVQRAKQTNGEPGGTEGDPA